MPMKPLAAIVVLSGLVILWANRPHPDQVGDRRATQVVVRKGERRLELITN